MYCKKYFIFTLLYFSISLIGLNNLSYVQANTSSRGLDLLPHAIKNSGLEKGDTIYFLEDNKKKIKIINETLAKFKPSKQAGFAKTLNVKDNVIQDEHLYFSNFKNAIQAPIIEFKKINPTKYRLRIHGAKSEFPVIFSEAYHSDWKLYLVPWKNQKIDLSSISLLQSLSSYDTTTDNDSAQASSEELLSFSRKGWVTDLGKEVPSKTNPYNFLKNFQKGSGEEKVAGIGFVSKNFSGTIQNNNLPDSGIEETWSYSVLSTQCFEEPQTDKKCQPKVSTLWDFILEPNSKVFLWPDLFHWKANGFANSWWLFPEAIKKASHSHSENNYLYSQNPDGSIDFEVIIEFWPQRLFYWGTFFSLIVFTLTFSALFIRFIVRKRFSYFTSN